MKIRKMSRDIKVALVMIVLVLALGLFGFFYAPNIDSMLARDLRIIIVVQVSLLVICWICYILTALDLDSQLAKKKLPVSRDEGKAEVRNRRCAT